MIVYAYLTRGHQIVVQHPGEKPPKEYRAVAAADSGLLEDWPQIVRYAHSVLWSKYIVDHDHVEPIVEHTACRQRTYLRRDVRKNLDGTVHQCPKSKARKR